VKAWHRWTAPQLGARETVHPARRTSSAGRRSGAQRGCGADAGDPAGCPKPRCGCAPMARIRAAARLGSMIRSH